MGDRVPEIGPEQPREGTSRPSRWSLISGQGDSGTSGRSPSHRPNEAAPWDAMLINSMRSLGRLCNCSWGEEEESSSGTTAHDSRTALRQPGPGETIHYGTSSPVEGENTTLAPESVKAPGPGYRRHPGLPTDSNAGPSSDNRSQSITTETPQPHP